jgi:hypothetical protein
MTASQPTPETGESISDEQSQTDSERGVLHMGALTACGHDLFGRGPAGHFSTIHAGNVDAEVFVDGGVWVAAESEEVARASTGIKLTAEGARRLAGLLEDAADELDDTEGCEK